VDVSVYRHFEWDEWPDDIAGALAPWTASDIARIFVNVGFAWQLADRVRELAAAASAVAPRDAEG
jgi:hypothetical protein